MKHFNVNTCIFTAALFCVILAFAANSSAAGRGPCSEEVEKFCKDIKPGGGAIDNCLMQHQNDLNVRCKDHVAKVEQKRELMKEARRMCRQDVAKFCRDVRPGGGRIIRCLEEHENELSAPCGERIKSARSIK